MLGRIFLLAALTIVAIFLWNAMFGLGTVQHQPVDFTVPVLQPGDKPYIPPYGIGAYTPPGYVPPPSEPPQIFPPGFNGN